MIFRKRGDCEVAPLLLLPPILFVSGEEYLGKKSPEVSSLYLNIFHSVLFLAAFTVLRLLGCGINGIFNQGIPRRGRVAHCADLIAKAFYYTQQEETAIATTPSHFSWTGGRGDDVALGPKE